MSSSMPSSVRISLVLPEACFQADNRHNGRKCSQQHFPSIFTTDCHDRTFLLIPSFVEFSDGAEQHHGVGTCESICRHRTASWGKYAWCNLLIPNSIMGWVRMMKSAGPKQHHGVWCNLLIPNSIMGCVGMMKSAGPKQYHRVSTCDVVCWRRTASRGRYVSRYLLAVEVRSSGVDTRKILESIWLKDVNISSDMPWARKTR